MQHPTQPIYMEEDGTVRFKANPIVRFLLNAGPYDMNALNMMPWANEDRVQFAQLIGYSVAGFGELPYVSNEEYDRASIGAGDQSFLPSGSVLVVVDYDDYFFQIYKVAKILFIESALERFKAGHQEQAKTTIDGFTKWLQTAGYIEDGAIVEPESADVFEAHFNGMNLVRVSRNRTDTPLDGAAMIAQERNRAKAKWSQEHDKGHLPGDLAAAAACYLEQRLYSALWPFRSEDWKPRSFQENLVRAGSLIAAELDRMLVYDHDEMQEDPLIDPQAIVSFTSKFRDAVSFFATYRVIRPMRITTMIEAFNQIRDDFSVPSFVAWLTVEGYLSPVYSGPTNRAADFKVVFKSEKLESITIN